ncbi:MAG: SDR family NAD(P)-dependent oxidoreductase [Candidatus Lokiarchaeota archaeon]|nr:SDR family NAD(P)-dependent oxidoreductase [Candidatus Lokiarchaeota archaeon]
MHQEECTPLAVSKRGVMKMAEMLKGEKAIITGSAQGIGKGIALKFAEEGCDILIVDLDAEKAEQTKKEILEKNPDVKVAVVASKETGDITNWENCVNMANVAKEELGGCSIVVNNAGLTLDKPIHTLPEGWWNIVLDVVLVGSFNIIKAFAPVMKEGGGGRIWNITSVAGITGNAAQINYSSAKAGLVGLTKAAARELADDNIAVNVVGFGAVWTRLVAPHDDIKIMGQKMSAIKATKGVPPEQMMKMYKSQTPMTKHRDTCLMPQDVGNFFAAVCSKEAHYLTGQWMIYSGGMAI